MAIRAEQSLEDVFKRLYNNARIRAMSGLAAGAASAPRVWTRDTQPPTNVTDYIDLLVRIVGPARGRSFGADALRTYHGGDLPGTVLVAVTVRDAAIEQNAARMQELTRLGQHLVTILLGQDMANYPEFASYQRATLVMIVPNAATRNLVERIVPERVAPARDTTVQAFRDFVRQWDKLDDDDDQAFAYWTESLLQMREIDRATTSVYLWYNPLARLRWERLPVRFYPFVFREWGKAVAKRQTRSPHKVCRVAADSPFPIDCELASGDQRDQYLIELLADDSKPGAIRMERRAGLETSVANRDVWVRLLMRLVNHYDRALGFQPDNKADWVNKVES